MSPFSSCATSSFRRLGRSSCQPPSSRRVPCQQWLGPFRRASSRQLWEAFLMDLGFGTEVKMSWVELSRFVEPVWENLVVDGCERCRKVGRKAGCLALYNRVRWPVILARRWGSQQQAVARLSLIGNSAMRD